MKELIQRMLRVWDPYDLRVFPSDEYDSYARSICDFIDGKENLTLMELTDFVYELFEKGMSIDDSKMSGDPHTKIEELDKAGSLRFAELYFSIMEFKQK